MILLPIGRELTMNASEAAFALKHYFPTPKIVIPMDLTGETDTPFDYDGFVRTCNQLEIDKKFIHPKQFFGGKALLE